MSLPDTEAKRLRRLLAKQRRAVKLLDYKIAPRGIEGAYQLIEEIRGAEVQIERLLGLEQEEGEG